MDSYKIESRLGLIWIQSLDYSNKSKTRRVNSTMIIVDNRVKYKDIKVKDIKKNNSKCKEHKSIEQECKELKNKE